MSKSAEYIDRFLPMTAEELRRRGWDRADVILITADAYVDHPSFGAALIGRWLEKLGYRVAVLAQPDWRSVEPFRALGRPRLFWGITSGCIDSRLNDYASLGHRRRQTSTARRHYGPATRAGRCWSTRPASRAYRDVPIAGRAGSQPPASGPLRLHRGPASGPSWSTPSDLLIHGMGERRGRGR